MILTKINVEQISKYMQWVRNIQMYPPQYSPEEYADWVEKTEAQVRIKMINETIFASKGLTITEIYDKIIDILNEDLEVDIL